jgi:hypothetical protein
VVLSVGTTAFATLADATLTPGTNCPGNAASDANAAEGQTSGRSPEYVSLNGGTLRARVVSIDSGLTMVVPTGASLQVIEFDDGEPDRYGVSLCEDSGCGGGGPHPLGSGAGSATFTY